MSADFQMPLPMDVPAGRKPAGLTVGEAAIMWRAGCTASDRAAVESITGDRHRSAIHFIRTVFAALCVFMGYSGTLVSLGVAWLTVLHGRKVGNPLEIGPLSVADWEFEPRAWRLTFNGIRSESGGVPADFKIGVAAISLFPLDFPQFLAFGLAIDDCYHYAQCEPPCRNAHDRSRYLPEICCPRSPAGRLGFRAS